MFVLDPSGLSQSFWAFKVFLILLRALHLYITPTYRALVCSKMKSVRRIPNNK